MKDVVCTLAGVAGATLTAMLGGWNPALVALVILIVSDYITGLIVAGVFHASKKSPSGALESKAGWKGLCRKVVTLMFVVIAHWLDQALGTSFIRDGVIYGYMTNELISLVENAGLMGVPMPTVIEKAIDVLTTKAEKVTETGKHEDVS